LRLTYSHSSQRIQTHLTAAKLYSTNINKEFT